MKIELKKNSAKFLLSAFRYLILIGLSFLIIYPLVITVLISFMQSSDIYDSAVRFIPKSPTLQNYIDASVFLNYWESMGLSVLLNVILCVVEMVSCLIIAYGFAKFRFKFNSFLFLLVVFTMVVPHSTLKLSMFMEFRYFDILGILNLLGGGVTDSISILENTSANLLNSYWPLWILSATGLAFKNGLYIFLLRQFFKGVPDELEESAYVDGAGVFRTFVQIILPLSIPMLITVFMFAFSWQWTDNFYTETFFTTTGPTLMPDIVAIPTTLNVTGAGASLFTAAITNTCGLMIIVPLVIIYAFAQKYIVQGIERSGITG